VFAGALVYGFVATPKVYTAAPFTTLIAVMPVEAWAAVWATVAATMVLAGLLRSGLLWLVGVITSILLAVCWVVGLAYQWVVNRTPLSPSGVALWCWLIFTLLMFVRSPRQFEQTGSG
jgi:hypothetical protein